MTPSPPPATRHRRSTKRIAVVVAIGTVAVGLGIAVTLLAQAWSGKPYPVTDPVTAAHRLDARTQDVYDAMALPPVHLETVWGHNDISAGSSGCGLRGIQGWLNRTAEPWRPAPGTYAITEDWKVANVTRPVALAALQRAQQTLVPRGWTVVSYSPSSVQLVLRPPAPGDDTVEVGFLDPDLEVRADSACATVTSDDFPYLPGSVPSPSAPSQLRN